VAARRGDEAVARDGAAEAQVLRRADAKGRKGGRKKALWLAGVKAEAEKLVAWAEGGYAKTRPPPSAHDERREEARLLRRPRQDGAERRCIIKA
jgi:hypothetical protein